MNKELEALNKIQHDFGQLKGQELVSCYETIFNVLKRLESIDNATPSEALERLEQFINEMTRCLENPKEYVKGYEKQIFWKYKNTLETTIKQALLKAQQPKQYLKWEDLEFKEEEQTMKVLLNGNKYTLDYYSDGYDDYIDFLTDNEQDRIAIYEGGYPHDKQFFNDLHLERVEE